MQSCGAQEWCFIVIISLYTVSNNNFYESEIKINSLKTKTKLNYVYWTVHHLDS